MSQEPDNRDPEQVFVDVVRKDGRYPLEAFAFLHQSLDRAAKEIHRDLAEDQAPGERADPRGRRERHVTGQQFCQTLRQEAIDRWGLLARTVLANWHIHATIDFGNMVYLLVENELMGKTEEDSLEDFRDVYDFEEAFGAGEVFNE